MPTKCRPIAGSHSCVYYYTDIRPVVVNEVILGDCLYTESIATNLDGEVVYKKHQNFNSLLDGPVGTVQFGMDKEPICIPRNAMLTVPGNTSRIDKSQSYIVEQAAHHNLPHGLVVNSCCVTPKVRRVPVILINTTDQNISVTQPLLATELFKVELEPQWYCTEINHEGDEIVISFLPAPQHVKTKNKWRIMQWRWKKIQTHQQRILSQWNIQSLERCLTLGRPMILKKK